MQEASQIDLGATILSITVAGGFVALAFMIFRILFMSISKAIKGIRRKNATQKSQSQ